MNSGKVIYEFKTESGTDYLVIFDPEEDGTYLVTFAPWGSDPSSMTNEGNSVAVISTVSDIVKDFLSKFDNKIKKLKIQASKSEEDREKMDHDSKRFRVYQAILSKYVDRSKYDFKKSGDNEITITKKTQS